MNKGNRSKESFTVVNFLLQSSHHFMFILRKENIELIFLTLYILRGNHLISKIVVIKKCVEMLIENKSFRNH